VKEVLPHVEGWLARGKKVAVATVIATERSAPRDPGAVLAVTEDMEMAGSVSAGCVEAAVAEEAAEVIRTGRPKRLTYGISDDEAFAVGLSCGGILHVFVAPLERDEIQRRLEEAIRKAEPVALATKISGAQPGARMLIAPHRVLGTLDGPDLDAAVTAGTRAMLERGQTGIRRYDDRTADGGEVEVFIQSFASPPQMYVFGTTPQAAAVVRMGKFLGYRVTVCDARAALATTDRVPGADEIVVEWPDAFLAQAPVDRRTVICVLTHDPKFDIPVLGIALGTPAAYVGVLGSRRTHETRCRKLAEAGVSKEALARIRAPIGLDIGARTPEEVAVAIAAEIVAARSGTPAPMPQQRSSTGRAAAGEPA
jgi:xanthine dehydrogenase accessory factor